METVFMVQILAGLASNPALVDCTGMDLAQRAKEIVDAAMFITGGDIAGEISELTGSIMETTLEK